MEVRLPPLNALRALESAGRNVSFTTAARELHVTPGAISRQIRRLEDYLGFPLFERSHREVKLNPATQIYVNTLTDLFRQVDRATKRLLDSRRERFLHIHTAITFTLRWLVPRLASFHSRYPKQEILLSTALPVPGAAELNASPTDVAIRITDSAGAAAEMQTLAAHRLFGVELVPVCSPSLLLQGRKPNELEKFTLLHSLARPNDWATWLNAAGAANVDPQGGIRFESSSLAYQAAIEGIGVAIGMRALVEADIKSGRLITPFEFTYSDDHAWYLFYSQAAAKTPQVVEFRDWIISEIEPRAEAAVKRAAPARRAGARR